MCHCQLQQTERRIDSRNQKEKKESDISHLRFNIQQKP